jgi:hypothetical protein
MTCLHIHFNVSLLKARKIGRELLETTADYLAELYMGCEEGVENEPSIRNPSSLSYESHLGYPIGKTPVYSTNFLKACDNV